MANTLLRTLLTVRHIRGYEEFARLFRRTAQDLAKAEGDPQLSTLSVSLRQYERWIGGDVKSLPRPDTRRVLEEIFGRPAHVLFGSSDQLGSQADDHVEPEEAGRTIAMAARRARAFSAAADATNVGPETLDELRDEAARLVGAYPQEPLSLLLPDLVNLQDQTFTLLEGRQRPGQARDLYIIGGLASGMLAKASHDLRDPLMAMTHARTGVLCARNADNAPLTAWLRGIESLIKYWAAQPREAAEYAQAGLDIAGVTGTARVWLAALKARAEAVIGRQDAALRAIGHAADFREHATPDELDALGGMCHFSYARERYYAADAATRLPLQSTGPLIERAASYAAEAIDAYEHGEPSFGDEAGARSALAIARIRNGELDGAAEAIAPVLDLPPQLRINGVIMSAVTVHEALAAAAPDSPVARDTQQQIEVFCHTPAAALPRLCTRSRSLATW
jgi:hypothetical protein